MAGIPNTNPIDSSLRFRKEGYAFVSNNCRRLNSDIFAARLLGRKFHCVVGADAARMFYEPGRFTRRGALPRNVLHLLQDEGSVAVLNGSEHRRRKQMFLSMMTSRRLQEAARLASEVLLRRADSWPSGTAVSLHEQMRYALCETVATWAGIPTARFNVEELGAALGAMIDNAGSFGPSNWRARWQRRKVERWARNLIEDTRQGRIAAPNDSALVIIAHHADADEEPLSLSVAAVELINILRPTVAVARFMVFAALALHQYPSNRDNVLRDDETLEAFVHEVRRFYPFFPIVAGVALEDFGWRDHEFRRNDRFILDLYGTDHDPRTWSDPETFRAERFRNWSDSPFDFIPQGGGSHAQNHRCAGEWLTIALMKAMLKTLAGDLRYEVPLQDLSVPLNRVPALPTRGFIITNVKCA